MTDVEVILGIDPAIAYTKPFACVTLRDDGGRAELLRHAPATKIGNRALWYRKGDSYG